MSDDVTGWLGAMVASAGFAFGLYQYRVNSFSAARARCREQAIKAADELEVLVTDPDVEIVLRLIDYSGGTIPMRNLQQTDAVERVNRHILLAALDHHGDRCGRANERSSEERAFNPVEVQIRRLFDRFLTRLERIETLIRNGVIARNDFEALFSYWLELIGERPKPGDAIAHVDDELRGKLWAYIRYYRFDGVVKLFQRFGRAGPVGAVGEAAFVARSSGVLGA
ncbi:hypothetical protein [Methylocella sp.]|uniref:hypothetical protein n=1 Tax=Methylocella sp. TaxID=1978226 RepID=UPI003783A79F